MRKGYRVTLGIITIMILLTISVGTSYSFYSVSSVQDGDNNLVATCFKMNIEDSDYINLPATYPMSEDSAKTKLTPYKFTITNNCTEANASAGVNYDIVLNTKGTLNNYLSYKFSEGTTITGLTNKLSTSTYTYQSYVPENTKMAGTTNSYLLKQGTLAPGASASYNLLLWINSDACEGNACKNDVMTKSFEGQVLVLTSMGVATTE